MSPVTEVINKKCFHAHEIKTREILFSAMSFASLVVIMLYDKVHKTKTIEFFFASQSVTVTQRNFKRHFKSTKAPSRNTILWLVDKFRKEGTVDNLRGTAGRRKLVRTPQTVKQVVHLIEEDPEQSCRQLAQKVGCSRATTHRILRQDIGLYPYKICVKQTLSDGDKEGRKMFSSWLVEMCRQSENCLDNIWFSDEAHFYLDGHVSPQNCRFWAAESPDLVKEKPLHSPKVTVWCAISSSGIIGPL